MYVTAGTLDESLDLIRRVRAVVAEIPVWLGGGATTENVGRVVDLVDGVTVATSIKHGDMANPVDPRLAAAFVGAIREAGSPGTGLPT